MTHSPLFRRFRSILLIYVTCCIALLGCGGSGSSSPDDQAPAIPPVQDDKDPVDETPDPDDREPDDSDNDSDAPPGDDEEPAVTFPTIKGLPEGAKADTLTAGDIDDTLNLEAYQTYLYRTTMASPLLPIIRIDGFAEYTVVDDAGQPLAGAKVRIEDEFGIAYKNLTGQSGKFTLFPGWDDLESALTVEVVYNNQSQVFEVDGNGGELEFSATSALSEEAPAQVIDIALLIDATGSMVDEIIYLQTELVNIIQELDEQHPDALIRVAITHYRDHGERYVVKGQDFLPVNNPSGLEAILNYLNSIRAGGGGDKPEAVGEALEHIAGLNWNSLSHTRVLLMMADAPPRTNDFDLFMDASKELRDKGVHIYPIGASGVGEDAEYLMRALAAYTQGRYLFLTDDSDIGDAHAFPSVPCYIVTKLSNLLLRVLNAEIMGERIEPEAEDILKRIGSYDEGECEDETVSDGQQFVDFEKLYSSQYALTDAPATNMVVYNEGAFAALWQTYVGQEVEMPVIDFDEEMIIMTARGVQTSGAAQTEIINIEETQDSYLITIQHSDDTELTGDASLSLTAPIDFVRVPRSTKSIVFRIVEAPSSTASIML